MRMLFNDDTCFYTFNCQLNFWWQVSFTPTSSLHLQLLSCFFSNCQEQHVNMLRMHPRMLGQSLSGKWIKPWLMFVHISTSDVVFETYSIWIFLPVLLPLLLTPKLAHTLVVWTTCVCWHLACGQTVRDEGREQSPLVYEEDCSETKVFLLYSKLWLVSFLYWCPAPDIKLCHYLAKLKSELEVAECLHAPGLQKSQSAPNVLLLAYDSAVWNPPTTVLTKLCYVFNGTTNCIMDLYIIVSVIMHFYFGKAGTAFPRVIE